MNNDNQTNIEPLNSEPSDEMKAINQIRTYWENAYERIMGLPASSFKKKSVNIGENTDNKGLSANTPID